MTPSTVYSTSRIAFWTHHADGCLTVFPEEKSGVPFPIRRVFTIAGVSANGTRANHAHRRCTQLLACLAGSVSVKISDTRNEATEHLAANGIGLLIPPLLWNSVTFEGPATVLAVFCDELYEEDDYLRDWNEYLALKHA
jgi:dTDP-4-dehydrorhamnose 3,5-epimerase-like enzyme